MVRKIFFLFVVSLLLLISGCGSSKKKIEKLDDAADSKIGVMTGTTGEQLAIKRFPKATVKSFDDIMDAVAALKSDQIDAVITAMPTAMNVCKRNKELMFLKEAVDFENTAIALRKGNEKLLNELNSFIAELKDNGTLKDMKRRWFKMELTPYETVDIKVPEKGEPIKVGVSATREPFCFLDQNKKVTGHDGELARRVSVRLGRPVEFVDMKFSALVTALAAGKIDLIITGMTATAERKKTVDFTLSYFENSQVMLTKKSASEENKNPEQKTKLSSPNDVKDKKLGVLLGSVHDTYAAKNYPNAAVSQYKSPSELILAVRSGKVDAAMYTTETLKEILKNDPELATVGDTLFSIPIAMGFNKESVDLKEKFNKFLRSIRDNGTYGDMVDRWINKGTDVMPEIKIPKSSGTLVVGVVSDKGLPFTIIKNNKMIGFDIELCERFAAFLGKELKLNDMEFGSLIIAAASKKIDMVASTLMITEERKKQIDFSDPYMRLGASIFALKNNVELRKEPKIKSLTELADKRIGVYAGTVHDSYVAGKYPNADVMRFNGTSDMILALTTGKVDAAFFDLFSAKALLKSNPGLTLMMDNDFSLPIGMGFNKNNPQLRDRFNAFLKKIKGNGTFDIIYNRWFTGDPEKVKMPSFPNAGGGKLINLGVAVGDLPYSAFVDGEYIGFDIELLKTFAQSEGYELKISTMEFSALVASLAAGKVDMITDGIVITAERQKQIAFSDSHLEFKSAVVIYNEPLNNDTSDKPSAFTSFFKGIGTSFENNIILERRYLLILDGLKTTAVISILSILFGTLLGSLVCFMRMSKRKLLLYPAKIYISLLRGTPVLVILMIIFYVIFASVDIEPVIVAVLAFGMNFAAYVSEMFRTGIEGVDRGQTEAGIAMGFTKFKTFVFIVAPQAVRRILPVYKGEVISLVKMTSIVGYIAVQDLTKASDIIRSRTFDAFFPLIMVAVLYFLISWLLMLLLGYFEGVFTPKAKARREV